MATALPEVTVWICPETRLPRVSYYLQGLLEMHARGECRLRIVGGVPSWAVKARARLDPSKLFGFHLLGEAREPGGPPRRFAIDTTDSRTQIHQGVLEAVHRVFKVNYSPAGVDRTLPAALGERLSPVDPFFPVPIPSHADLVFKWRVNPLLAGLTRRRGLRNLRKRPTVRDLRGLRGVSKRRDVFANLTAWPHNAEERNALISRLKGMDIDFHGGFQPNELALRRFPENTLHQPLSTSDYFSALAESRLTLVVPGCHDCTPAKLPEQLAMGATILLIPSENTPDTPLRDGVEVISASTDLGDFENQVCRLLADDDERLRLSQAAAQRFDECLQPVMVARRVVAGLVSEAAREA